MERRRVNLREHRLAGEVLEVLGAAVLLHDHHLLVVHIRLGERVVVLSVFHGEAVPNAIDGAAADERVLRIPIDGLQLQLPAHLLAHGLGKLQVEARELAVIAHVAVGRVALVEAHRERERGVARLALVALLRVAAARAAGQHDGRQCERRRSNDDALEFLLHRSVPPMSLRPDARLPWLRAPRPLFYFTALKRCWQYNTAPGKGKSPNTGMHGNTPHPPGGRQACATSARRRRFGRRCCP